MATLLVSNSAEGSTPGSSFYCAVMSFSTRPTLKRISTTEIFSTYYTVLGSGVNSRQQMTFLFPLKDVKLSHVSQVPKHDFTPKYTLIGNDKIHSLRFLRNSVSITVKLSLSCDTNIHSTLRNWRKGYEIKLFFPIQPTSSDAIQFERFNIPTKWLNSAHHWLVKEHCKKLLLSNFLHNRRLNIKLRKTQTAVFIQNSFRCKSV